MDGGRTNPGKQILADTLGVELVTVNTTEGAAFGAALLAGVGAGLYSSVPEACQQMIALTGRTPPSGAQVAYQDFYPQYRALYPALADQFKVIAELTSAQSSGSSTE